MAIVQLDAAHEQATYAVTVAFTDDAGSAVTPNAGLVWSLLKRDGTAVNSRTDVSITPGTTVTIVLSGNDLALTADEAAGTAGTSRDRFLLVEGTYNSSLGTNLPIKWQARFPITNLVGV